MEENEECHIQYLDVQGYYDLGCMFLLIIIACISLRKTFKNLASLKDQMVEGLEEAAEQSLRRRLWVNKVQIIFLSVFTVGMIWQIILFFITLGNKTFVKDHKFNIIYKLCEITFINLLNILNLTVGLLYWKSINAYYTILDEKIPVLFRQKVGKLFYLFYLLNIVPIIITLLFMFGMLVPKIIVNLSALITVIFSIVICLGSRQYYRRYLLPQINGEQNVTWKQMLCSILLLLSCLVRLTYYTLNIFGYDYHQHLRKDDYPQCLDKAPYCALISLFLAGIIDLLPTFIYGHLFSGQNNYSKIYQDLLL